MILIRPDHDRKIAIAGVAAPVLRPVDIDQSKTGFTNLRTLRIYQFDEGTTIDGHAEEDEVFIIVLAGSIALTMVEADSTPGDSLDAAAILSAPNGEESVACAAYLPRGGAYKLVSRTAADVAYVRATPSQTRRAKVFFSSVRRAEAGVGVLLEEATHAERLHIRLVRFDAQASDLVVELWNGSGGSHESLVHVRSWPSHRAVLASSGTATASVALDSWDTVALMAAESLTLNVTMAASGLVLMVAAV